MYSQMTTAEKIEQLDIAIAQAEEYGLEVIVRENNSWYKGHKTILPTHLTFKGVRQVEYYPTKDTVYANGIRGKRKAIRSTGIKNAIEIAKNGKL